MPTTDHAHRAAQLAAWQQLWKRLLAPPPSDQGAEPQADAAPSPTEPNR